MKATDEMIEAGMGVFAHRSSNSLHQLFSAALEAALAVAPPTLTEDMREACAGVAEHYDIGGYSADFVRGYKSARSDTAAAIRAMPAVLAPRAFPEPMKEAPEVGADIWVSCPSDLVIASKEIWNGDPVCMNYLRLGLCHTTREAAQAHASAMLALSGGGE